MLEQSIDRSTQHIVIDAAQRTDIPDLRELWNRRDLLFHLARRDITIRYKQTIFGFLWVILQPMSMMVVYSTFMTLLNRGSNAFGSAPYPVAIYGGLLIWQFFISAFTRVSQSLNGNSALIKKVYFPRLIIPLAATIPAFVDFFYSFLAFIPLLIVARFVPAWHYTLVPTWHMIFLPFFLILALVAALGVGLLFAVLGVRFHDMNHFLPVLTQLWMFMSAVFYPVSIIPERYQLAYGMNPMSGVVEGFRWALLGGGILHPHPIILVSGSVCFIILALTTLFFIRSEKTFADTL